MTAAVTALIGLIGALIDESPVIISAVEALLAQKKQQYASVLASIQSQDAQEVAALQADAAKT